MADRRRFDCSGSIQAVHAEGASHARLLLELGDLPPVTIGEQIVVYDPLGWRVFGSVSAAELDTGDEQRIVMQMDLAEHFSIDTADEIRLGTPR